ncbi:MULTISPECIES: hypothetical protein [unclassified Bartonella]|uniref:hypothetical protein n=1 Tax=unclassified Bartonella TaxID=2645622 RepID=UPI0035CF4085
MYIREKGSWDFMHCVCFCHGMECGEINGERVSMNGGGSWDEEAGCIEERGESVGAEWE